MRYYQSTQLIVAGFEVEKAKMSAINIIVADDHDFLRVNLCMKLGECRDLKIIGEAANGQRAVELTRELKPDVIIMDITMPVMDGIEATRQITNEFPDAKVIGLSMHSDKELVEAMMNAGAKGYLLKRCRIEELIEAICSVFEGKIYLGAGIDL